MSNPEVPEIPTPSLAKGLLSMTAMAATIGTGLFFALTGESPEKDTVFVSDPCPPPSEKSLQGLQKALTRDSNKLRVGYLEHADSEKGSFAVRGAAADERLRRKLAKDYGLTLVGNKAVQTTLAKIVRAKRVDEIVDIVDGYTRKEFNTPTNLSLPRTEQTPYNLLEVVGYTEETNTDPAKVDFMRRNGATIVQDMARLPKELVEAADVTELMIANKIFETTADGTAQIMGFVLTGETSDLELSAGVELGGTEDSTVIHEYTHRWHEDACDGNQFNDPSFIALNPKKDFTYQRNWENPYTANEKVATTDEYATHAADEDAAESLATGIKNNFVITGKPIVGQKWGLMLARLNDVSKGSPGSYFAAYSRANPLGKSDILMPNISVKDANADSVGSAN